jgi:hypothetical protein
VKRSHGASGYVVNTVLSTANMLLHSNGGIEQFPEVGSRCRSLRWLGGKREVGRSGSAGWSGRKNHSVSNLGHCQSLSVKGTSCLYLKHLHSTQYPYTCVESENMVVGALAAAQASWLPQGMVLTSMIGFVQSIPALC